jgi:hypothetical protein
VGGRLGMLVSPRLGSVSNVGLRTGWCRRVPLARRHLFPLVPIWPGR